MIVEKAAEILIRIGRGQSLVYDLRNAFLIAAALKVLLELSIVQAGILTILIMIGFFIIGWIDLKYVKLMQKTAELTTSKYNPHLNKLNRLTEKLK